ncbi:MAG: aminopeptidase P family protein [Oscillospiraceae bacterium]|nr:aminopeptidase P family protein [Oscillospiraceae bacterium]
MSTVPERLARLRQEMKTRGIDVYVVPTADYHGSEYVGEHFKARQYATGFTGSAGTAVITASEAGLWTDGRYFIQAEAQLAGSGVTLYRMGEEGVPELRDFAAEKLPEGGCLGFDGRTVSGTEGRAFRELAEGKKGRLAVDEDLVGLIWEDRPSLPSGKVWRYGVEYAGRTVGEKLADVRREMEKAGADRHVLTSLYDIAWLLNVRGSDIAFVPVVLSYLALTKEDCVWFVRNDAVPEDLARELAETGVAIRPYDDIYAYMSGIRPGEKVMMDAGSVNYRLCTSLPAGAILLDRANPSALMKAVKNETELAATRSAHLKDAAVMCRFIYWLKKNVGKIPMTEISVSDHLAALAAQQPGFLDLSFGTICGYGPHGAIIHYGATPESDAPLRPEGLLLVDSGRHYLEGTTDITRTIALGPVTAEMKADFTRVARANLNLLYARFLYGCSGMNLDILAREPFWEVGADYKHGTGLGIGHVLNVHEGPNGFRWRRSPDRTEHAVLEEGMITSDEPGIYLEGKYGVRLENEILCRRGEKNEYGQFMYFENLTLVPFDLDAIDPAQMDDREKQRLNDFHREVIEKVAPLLTEEEAAWLREATRPI